MKKITALILLLTMLTGVLASCDQPNSPGGEKDNPPSYVGDGEQGSGDEYGPSGQDQPDEPEMPVDPSLDENGFKLFPQGNYLTDPTFDTEEYLPDYDADPSFIFGSSNSVRDFSVCSTDTAIYSSLAGSGNSRYLYRTDKETGVSEPLCADPECNHFFVQDCSAIVSRNITGLQVYDGKLYWVDQSKYQLRRINLDGTDPETVSTLSRDIALLRGGGDSAFIHRGYLYMSSATQEEVNGRNLARIRIAAQSLDGKDSFLLLDKYLNLFYLYFAVRPVGNSLYILLTNSNSGEQVYFELFRWDIATREGQRLYSNDGEDPNKILSYGSWSFQVVPGDGIYFTQLERLSNPDNIDGRFVQTNIMKYAFDTGEVTEVFHLYDGPSFNYSEPIYTPDYLAVRCGESGKNDEQYINLYSYDGTLIRQLDLKGYGFSSYLGIDGENIYAQYFPPAENESRLNSLLAIPLDGSDPFVVRGEVAG